MNNQLELVEILLKMVVMKNYIITIKVTIYPSYWGVTRDHG